MQRINGEELSNYVTKQILLGVAKKENNQGVKSRFMVLVVKNKKFRNTQPSRIIIWDDDEPGLINIVAKYKTDKKTPEGYIIVDIRALKESDDADEMDGYWEFPGMQMEQFHLRKGMCYLNDVDGKRRMYKATNEPVMTDTVSVLTQVDYIIENDGKLEVHYAPKWDLNTRGEQMENAFYREAVNTTTIKPVEAPEETAESTPDPNNPF